MSILVTWELGAGWGHIGRVAPVVRGLLAQGQEVVIAARRPERVAPLVPGAKVIPLPAAGAAPEDPIVSSTYSDILHNAGWHSEPELRRLTTAWRELIDQVGPRLIVMDHSPTALLASQGMPLRRVLLSTGFSAPPDLTPFPNLLPVENPALLQASGRREGEILQRVNRFLEDSGSPPLDRLSQLFARVDRNLLATWPELDHYGARRGAEYVGVWTDTLGERPEWPPGRGPKVFLYLKPFPALDALLHMLGRSRLPVLAYLSGAAPSASPQSIRVVADPVDMIRAANACDLAVLNGGHGATAVMLLGGTPLLQVPLVLEQFHVARRVVEMGAGQIASPDSVEQIARGLERLLTDPRYTRNARAFRERRKGYDPARGWERAVGRIAALL